MRINAFFIPAIATIATLSSLGTPSLAVAADNEASAARPQPPAQLSMSVARKIARGIAWEVARRNGSVNSVKINTCQRRAANRVACLALDRGSTSTLQTTCRVRIGVRLANGEPQGSLRGVDCRNRRIALLRGYEARTSMLLWGEKEVGREVQVGVHGRLSKVAIMGYVYWTRPSSVDPSKTELCTTELRSTLTEAGEVEVTPVQSSCFLTS